MPDTAVLMIDMQAPAVGAGNVDASMEAALHRDLAEEMGVWVSGWPGPEPAGAAGEAGCGMPALRGARG
jgi:hypothetical protein